MIGPSRKKRTVLNIYICKQYHAVIILALPTSTKSNNKNVQYVDDKYNLYSANLPNREIKLNHPKLPYQNSNQIRHLLLQISMLINS